MNDERLLAFVDWCRMNDYHVVHDLTIVRRVFRSYDTYEPDEDSRDDRGIRSPIAPTTDGQAR